MLQLVGDSFRQNWMAIRIIIFTILIFAVNNSLAGTTNSLYNQKGLGLNAIHSPTLSPIVSPTAGSDLLADTFEVIDLSVKNSASVDISTLITTYQGQIVVSSTNVYLVGDSAAVGLDKQTLETTNGATNGASFPGGFSVVTNLANNNMYAIGDNDGEFLLGPTGYAGSLIPLQSATLERNAAQVVIYLSEPVYVSFQSSLYAGFNRVYIMDMETSDYVQVSLLSGRVQAVGEVTERADVHSSSWLDVAVAEHSSLGVHSVLYVSQEGSIERQSVDVAHETSTSFEAGIGDITAIAVDAGTNKWYFYYNGKGPFGSGEAILGYADATFSLEVSESPADLFSVLELSEEAAVTIDVSQAAGTFQQTLAVSTSRVFASGDMATVSLPKETFDISALSSSANGGVGGYYFATDLASNEIFAFGDSDGNFLAGPTGYAECLVPLSPTSAHRDPSKRIVWFDAPVYMAFQSSVHSGFHRVLIVDMDTSDVVQINLRTGGVTTVGEVLPRVPDGAANWLNYGVAELPSSATPALLYASVEGGIERQAVAAAQNYVDELFSASLGQCGSIAVDAMEGRWYFFYTGAGVFHDGRAVLGHAAAAVSFDDLQPTSLPTAYPSAIEGTTEEDSFEIVALTSRHAEAVDVSPAAGNFFGAIGLSSSKVFVRGDQQTISVVKDAIESDNLWSAVDSEVEQYAFVTNIATNDLYALGDGDGNALTGATGMVECLISLHPATGTRNSNKRLLWFTEPIYLGFQSTVHWAYNRVIFVDHESSEAFVMHLRNGVVTPLEDTLDRASGSPYWLTIGVAEHVGESAVHRRLLAATGVSAPAVYRLLYASPVGDVERQDLSSAEQNVTAVFSSVLGSMASIALDAEKSRWYFYYSGDGEFGNGAAVLGRAFSFVAVPDDDEVEDSVMTVVELTDNHVEAVDVSSVAGNFYGTLAISSTRVFAGGDKTLVSLSKDTLEDATVLLTNTSVQTPSMVTDLSTNRLYVIGDSDGNILPGSTGYAECLVPLLPDGLDRDKDRRIVWFSEPIYLGFQSTMYAGYHRVLFRDQETSDTFLVNLATGQVTELAETLEDGGDTPAWMRTGIAVRPSLAEDNLIYASADGTVVRQSVSNVNTVEDLHAPLLGSVASIAVDVYNSKWYFFYAGEGSFGTGTAVLGRATGVFALEEDQEDTFVVQELLDSSAHSVDASASVGHFGGPFGVVSSNVFVGGNSALVALDKDSLVQLSAENADALPVVVSNVAGTQLYALGDEDGNFLSGPTGFAASLIPLLSASAKRDFSRRITFFTDPVYLGFQSSVYSGFYRAAFVDGESGSVSVVNLRTGRVTVLADAVDRVSESFYWVNTGVVDQLGKDNFRLLYGSKEGTVELQDLDNENTDIETLFSSVLGEVASISADISSSRWYFYYTGEGAFGDSEARVGYADMSHDSEMMPTSIPSAQPVTAFPSSIPSSQPSSEPSANPSVAGLEDDVFGVLAMTEKEVRAVDVSAYTGNFLGTLVMSSTKVLITGDSASVSLNKDLATEGSNIDGIKSVVTNLHTQEIYALGDGDGNFLAGSTGLVECLITLLPGTGARDTSHRLNWLTQPFYLGFQSAILSGFHRTIFIDSETSATYLVNLRNGRVTEMEETLDRVSRSANWLTYGLTEQPVPAEFSILYGSVTGEVEKQDIFNSTLAVSALTSSINDVMSIAIDVNSSRWYFSYGGEGEFGTGSAVVGYATAVITQEEIPLDIFSVRELLDDSQNTVEVSTEAGPFYGALGVSSSKVFVRGAAATVSFEKDSIGIAGSVDAVASEVWGYDFVMDVGSSQMYGLGDVDGNPLAGPVAFAESLIPLQGASGLRDVTKRLIWFTTPVYLGFHSFVHSGFRQIMLIDTESASAFVVSLRSGRVTLLDDVSPRSVDSPYWLHFGVAEHPYPSDYSVIYGSDEGYIERQLVKDSSPVDRAFSHRVGSAASVAVDVAENKWYYFSGGEGALSNRSAVLGYAAATFAFEEVEPTSYPTSSPTEAGLQDDFFTVDTLTTDESIFVEHANATGRFLGALSVSESRVFVRGMDAVVSLPKDDLDLRNASITTAAHGQAYLFVTDLATNQMYALGDGDGNFISERSAMYVECFIPLLRDTIQRDHSRRLTWFNQVIFLGFQSTVYSGFHRVVLVDEESGNTCVINMYNGRVSMLEDVMDRGAAGAYGLKYGAAEHPYHHDYSIVYAAMDGTVERQHIDRPAVVENVFEPTLGVVSSIAVDVLGESWYCHFTSDGEFESDEAVLSKAAATFQFEDMQPTSQPSSMPTVVGFEADIFVLSSISETKAITVDVVNIAGQYFGGLAVSSQRIFVSGTNATISVPKEDLDTSQVLSSLHLAVGPFIYVTNVGTNQMYAFGDSDGDFVEQPLGYVRSLIACDPDSGARDDSVRIIWLSRPILLTYKSGIYSGFNRIMIFDRVASNVLTISLANGVVRESGVVVDRFPTMGLHALSFGVNEMPFAGESQLLYAGINGQVERQKVSVEDYTVSVLYSTTLGDVASIAVDNSTNSWYFFYAGRGTFGESTAMLGRADSIPLFQIEDPTSYPTSFPTESGLEVDSFALFNFTSYDNQLVDLAGVVGGFQGLFLLSGSNVIVGGDAATVSVPKNAFEVANAVPLNIPSARAYVFVSDISNSQAYVLGDGDANFMAGPTGVFECLIAVDAQTMQRDTSQRTLWLTRVLVLSYQSGIYSGNRRVVIVDKVSTISYVINLRNGRVKFIGSAIERAPVASVNALTYGVSEHPYSTEFSIVSATLNGQAERQWVSTAHSGIDIAFTPLLGDVASIAVDGPADMWYFCYTGSADFGNSTAMLGSALISAQFDLPQPSSYPTAYPTVAGLEEDFFSIVTLSTAESVSFDVAANVGRFTGPVAISTSKVFVAGSDATVGFLKDTLVPSDVSNVTAIRSTSIIVSDIANNQMYALCDGDGIYVDGPSAYFEGLVPLVAETAERDASKRIIWMTEVLFVPYKSSIHAGFHRIVIFNKITSTLHYVNLRNGRVTSFDDMIDRMPVSSIGWYSTGVMEHSYFGENAIVYPSLNGQIERQPFPSDEPLVDLVFSTYLGDVASIAVDGSTNRWYFHYSGDGTFGEGGAVLGHADASLYFEEIAAPTSQPTSRPSLRPTSQPSSHPSLHHTPQPTRSGTQMYFTIVQNFDGFPLSFALRTNEWLRDAFLAVTPKNLVGPVNAPKVRVALVNSSTTVVHSTQDQSTRTVALRISVSLTLEDFETSTSSTGGTRVHFAEEVQRMLTENSPSAQYNSMTSSYLAADLDQSMNEYTTENGITNHPQYTAGDAEVSPLQTYATSDSAAPTLAPTSFKGAPVVTSISSNRTRSSVTLQVRFTPEAAFAGKVYCTALKSPQVLVSTDQLVAGTFSSYLPGVSFTEMTITGLQSLTEYNTYCYIQNVLGASNSLEVAESSRVSLTTLCCKLLTFTSAPEYVYATADKSTSYPWVYSLSSNPGLNVTVSPQILNRAGAVVSASTLTTRPTSVTFTSTSNLLTSSFIFFTSSVTLTGDFTVNLLLSGPSQSQYTSTSSSLTVLSSFSPKPAPKLSSIIFSNSGAAILIAFNSPTNRANLGTQPWTCSDIFSYDGASTASCVWVNSTVAKASFGAYVTGVPFLNLYENVTLRANKLIAECLDGIGCDQYPMNVAQIMRAAAPESPIPPIVVITMYATVTTCDNVTIDTSLSNGHGSRDWAAVSWVVRSTADVSTIQTYLNSFGVFIREPITMPSRFFVGDTSYSISLTLTNFLGQTKTDSSVLFVDSRTNLPLVNILQTKTVSILPSEQLTIYTNVRRSSCAEPISITYNWTVSNAQQVPVPITQRSNDPTVLLLDAYSLSGGQSYTAQVTATAAATSLSAAVSTSALVAVLVKTGDVQVRIAGGAQRSVLTNADVIIDASGSFDANSFPKSSANLVFAWTCVYSNAAKFGQKCKTNTGGNLIATSYSASVLTLKGSVFVVTDTYKFTVVAIAPDKRAGSSVVTIQPLVPEVTTSVFIPTTVEKVNADQKLEISSRLTATYGLNAKWSATIDGAPFNFDSLTSKTGSFSLDELKSYSFITFPIAIDRNVLSPGSLVTFRLTADKVGESGSSRFASFGEVSILVNAPPSGGSFTVTPQHGLALSTNFILLASSWSDESEDLPLLYSFKYQVSSLAPLLELQSRKGTTTVSTQLPQGLEPADFEIVTTVIIFDTPGASVSTTFDVTVDPNDDLDPFEFLTANLDTSGKSVIDTSVAAANINNIASTMGVNNCTLASASYCASLNRDICVSTPNTCGKCLSDYIGIVGDTNKFCYSKTAAAAKAQVNQTCALDSDCLYDECTNGICTAPLLTCPSNSPEVVCSGHGYCAYSDPAGRSLDTCSQLDVRCSAVCSCEGGYGGQDCSFDNVTLANRDATRSLMCRYFITIAETSNLSPLVMDTFVGTVLSVYDASEASNATAEACFTAVTYLTTYAAEGGLTGTKKSTAGSLLAAANKFVAAGTGNSTVLVNAINQISSGVVTSMTNGQDPIDISSGAMRMKVVKSQASTITTLNPPKSDAEIAYGAQAGSGMEMATGTASSCDSGGGYVSISVVQWSASPFPGAAVLETPQMKFESKVSAAGRRRQRKLSAADIDDGAIPLYYLSFQFNAPKYFDPSIDFLHATPLQLSNVTFPDCTYFDPDSGEYLPCQGCKMSSYTNYNVTYGCYDVSQICGGGSDATSGRLHRFLQGDDDGGGDDAGFGEQTSITSINFGALLSTFTGVIGGNPLAINFEQAKAIIAFVICLLWTIGFGYWYFRRWDIQDHHMYVYRKADSRIKLKKDIAAAESTKLPSVRGSLSPTKVPSVDAFGHGSADEGEEIFGTNPMFANGSEMEFRESTISTASAPQPLPKTKYGSRMSTMFTTLYENVHAKLGSLVTVINTSGGNTDMKNLAYDPLSEAEEVDENDVKTAFATEVVSEYINSVMPNEKTFAEGTTWYDTCKTLLQQHPYTVMFYGASLQYSRVLRWTSLVMGTLINLFVDTLFFSTFFPDTGECQLYTDEATCITPLNSALGTPLCTWKKDPTVTNGGSCTLTPPPEDMTFTMIIVMLTVMIAVPMSFVFDFVLVSYCKQRPNFAWWGFNNEEILGRTTQSAAQFNKEELNSAVKILRDHFDDDRREEAKSYAGKRLAEFEHELATKAERDLKKFNYESPKIFAEFDTADSEAILLLQSAKRYLDDNNRKTTLPWNAVGSSSEVEDKVAAIQTHLGIYQDGSPLPMTIWDTFWYGDSKSKLISLIEEARGGAEEIRDALIELGDTELASREVALIQFFMAEHFSTFKRYILNGQLFAFSSTSAMPISPTKWVLAWAFIFGMELFFVYWMLMWGVSSGGSAIKSWALNFSIGAIQDIFCIAPIRIIILYILAMSSIKPQLRFMHRTLHIIAMNYVQDKLPDNYEVIKVVQHFSPACRAARMHVSMDLAAGEILRALDDKDAKDCERGAEFSLSTWAIIFVSIPVVIGVLSETGGEVALDTALPCFLSMIILAHYLMLQTSIFLLIMPYIMVIGFFLTRRYLYAPALQRVHQIRQEKYDRQKTVSRVDIAAWRTATRNTPMHVLAYHKFRKAAIDSAALTIYYLGFFVIVRQNFMRYWNKEEEHHVQKQWKLLNLPLKMQGRLSTLDEHVMHAHTAEAKSRTAGDELFVELPKRVQKMAVCRDWTELWELNAEDEEGGYFTTLMNKKFFNMASKPADAPEPAGNQLVPTTPPKNFPPSAEATQFRDFYAFCYDGHAVLVHVLFSYRRQLLDGKLYNVSLLDEMDLTEATTIEALTAYQGMIHVRDLAMMLADLLHYYRPFGFPLTTQARRFIITQYDKWIVKSSVETIAFGTDLEKEYSVDGRLSNADEPAEVPISGYYEPCWFAYRAVRDFSNSAALHVQTTTKDEAAEADSKDALATAKAKHEKVYTVKFAEICKIVMEEDETDHVGATKHFVDTELQGLIEPAVLEAQHVLVADAAVSFDTFCLWFLELNKKLLPRIAKEHNIDFVVPAMDSVSAALDEAESKHSEPEQDPQQLPALASTEPIV